MATGRTLPRWERVYIDGYDLSLYGRKIGALSVEWDMTDVTAPMADAVRGVLPNKPNISPGTFDAIFDNTATSGLQARLGSPAGSRNLMVPIGIRAAPLMGDPVFAGAFNQLNFKPGVDNGAVVADINFSEWDALGLVNYTNPWGVLLHAKGAETVVNSAVGFDNLAATALGGYLMYQSFAGNGTATIKVQDAAVNNNGGFADLVGATSGVLDFSTPRAGIVAIGKTAAVRQYLRWQIVLGTATTITFCVAWIPGR